MALLQRCAGVAGFHLDTVMAREGVMADTLARLFATVDRGKVTPAVAASFPLGDAAAAHRLMESRQAAGQILLRA